MKFNLKKQNRTTLTCKQWVVLWSLLLAITPPTAANASVFDPLVKLFLPLYEKITGKDEESEQETPEYGTDISTDTVDKNIAPVQEKLPTLSSPSHTKTPDLMTILLAEFAYDRGDPQTALTLYKSQALKDNATAVFERALGISMQYETAEDSLAFSRTWQAKNPNHTPAWFYTTHLALKAEDYATVSQNLKQILEYDPKVDLGQIFEGIFPENRQTLWELFYELQALDNEDNASLSVLKAGLLVRLNEPTAAILYLNNALKDEPNNLAYHLLKADTLKNHPKTPSEPNDALLTFLKNSEKNTSGNTQKQLYIYHARYLIDNGNLAGAWQLLKPITHKFNDDFQFNMLTALVALDTEHYQDAINILTPLSQNSENPSEALYYLGISHERKEEYKSALKAYRQVNDIQYVLNATQKTVALELAFGNIDSAINALVKLRQNFEMYAGDSYILQADILTRLNKKAEAKQLLRDAFSLYPDDTELLYAHTKLLDNKEEFDEKVQLLTTLIDGEPDNMAYRLDLAELMLSKNPEDAESLALAKQVNESQDGYDSQLQLKALELLAAHALYTKDYKAVIDYLEAPYQIAPTLPIGILLVRAHQGLGDNKAVQNLLADLQSRFGQNHNTTAGAGL